MSIGFSKIGDLVSHDFGHNSFREVETAEGRVQGLEKQMGENMGKVEYDIFQDTWLRKKKWSVSEGGTLSGEMVYDVLREN